MDILHLVDRLEEILNQSRPIWFTNSVIADENRILDLIDQMRIAIPEEVKKSQQILSQRDRILAQSEEEANRTLAIAREKSEQLIERDAIVQGAKVRAEQILLEARSQINHGRLEVDDYALQTLSQLEQELTKFLSQVKNGINVLKSKAEEKEKTSEPEEE